jgi:hypothetical protein
MRFIPDEDLSWQTEVIPQSHRGEPVALMAGERCVALILGVAPGEDPRDLVHLIEQNRAIRAISCIREAAGLEGLDRRGSAETAGSESAE